MVHCAKWSEQESLYINGVTEVIHYIPVQEGPRIKDSALTGDRNVSILLKESFLNYTTNIIAT